MASNQLLIFDFDGVIVDGMNEYWWSARKACIQILNGQSNSPSLPNNVPKAFVQLRPWVHHGWEMVLLAAELLRPKGPLLQNGPKFFSEKYHLRCNEALKAWGWHPNELQEALENVRKWSIANDQQTWLARHQPFSFVIKRLNQLNNEGIEWAVLTTKGTSFTATLLDNLNLKPNLLLGHESGSKVEVLVQLAKNRGIHAFIEDRRTTLEAVLNTPELASIPCYLASWGYLKPEDKLSLQKGLHILEPQTLAAPLATWL